MIASIPSPSANSISLGPFDLNAYGLMIALGVIAAIWMLGRRLEQKGWGTRDDASAVGMWSVAAGVVGARLYHVATDWERFSGNVSAIPKIWEGGLGIPGGLLLGTGVGIYVGSKRGIPPAKLLTAAAPAIPLAQAIGRLGNWFNQELFGKATDLPWGLEIDDAHTPAGYSSDTTFHPTFLYESLWNLGLVALLLWIDRRFRLAPGRLFAVYVLGYGVGRFWIEGLRIDPVELSDVAGMRWNQWVALASVVGGGAYLIATRGQTADDPVADDADLDGADDADLDGDGIDDGDEVDDAAADVDDVDAHADLANGSETRVYDHTDELTDEQTDGLTDGLTDEVSEASPDRGT